MKLTCAILPWLVLALLSHTSPFRNLITRRSLAARSPAEAPPYAMGNSLSHLQRYSHPEAPPYQRHSRSTRHSPVVSASQGHSYATVSPLSLNARILPSRMVHVDGISCQGIVCENRTISRAIEGPCTPDELLVYGEGGSTFFLCD